MNINDETFMKNAHRITSHHLSIDYYYDKTLFTNIILLFKANCYNASTEKSGSTALNYYVNIKDV